MKYLTHRRRGFTLIELLMVIAIIGIIAAIVMVSLSESRMRARNAAVISQMQEYQKALELYYSDTGVYPSGYSSNENVQRSRVTCFGDDAVGSCFTGAFSRVPNPSPVNTALNNYISTIPRSVSPYGTSPAYSGCTTTADPPIVNSNINCTTNDYSIFFILEGPNQDCGRADIANSTFASGQATLCRLQKS